MSSSVSFMYGSDYVAQARDRISKLRERGIFVIESYCKGEICGAKLVTDQGIFCNNEAIRHIDDFLQSIKMKSCFSDYSIPSIPPYPP